MSSGDPATGNEFHGIADILDSPAFDADYPENYTTPLVHMALLGNLRSILHRAGISKRTAPADRLQQEITRELAQVQLASTMDFPLRVPLPVPYGKGLPERVVELLLVKATYQPRLKILDVGHANAMACHLALIDSLTPPRDITGMDIAQPADETAAHYQRSVIGDMTACPFADGSFDLVWCISALEHIGMDNSAYTKQFKVGQELMAKAVGEMVRIVRPGGHILVTVPFGKHENHGWFLNFGHQDLEQLLDGVRAKCQVHELFYRHTYGQGWTEVSARELEHVGYYDQCNCGAGGLAALYLSRNS